MDNLGKAASEVETHAVELRESVNFELQIRKLKSRLDRVHDEGDEVFQEVGRMVLESLRKNEPITRNDYQDRLDYIDGLDKKMRDLEGKINDLYKKKNEDNCQDEVIVDPKDDERGN